MTKAWRKETPVRCVYSHAGVPTLAEGFTPGSATYCGQRETGRGVERYSVLVSEL